MTAPQTSMEATCIQCGQHAMCVSTDRGWVCLKCHNQPGRRVRYQSENRFLSALTKLYGNLPLEQLITRWKEDEEKAPHAKT